MNLVRAFFSNFLWILKKGRGDLPPPPPSSYAPVIKVQISRLSTAQVKVFLQSLNLFSVSWEIILLTLYMLLKKVPHQSATFQTCHCSHLKFTQFLMSFLEPRVSFSSNFSSLFSVKRHNCTFSSKYLYVLDKRIQSKCKFSGLTFPMKINHIPYVFFQVTNQLSFKFCITLQCHDA